MNRWIVGCVLSASMLTLDARAVPAVESALLRQLSEASTEATVGEWVLYQASGGPGRTVFWRMAVVGQEPGIDGTAGVWIELEVGHHPSLAAPLLQVRMLMERAQGSTNPGRILRMFVGLGADRVKEVGAASLARMAERRFATRMGAQPSSAAVSVVRGREQRLTTYAGSVLALPIELRTQGALVERLWMSREIPLLHLARLELPAVSHVLEIRAYGADATPRIARPLPGAPQLEVLSSEWGLPL